jgi:hypothetical protein
MSRCKVDDLLDVYLESERTIILAVIPANQDIATVDILERAAEVRSMCLAASCGCRLAST